MIAEAEVVWMRELAVEDCWRLVTGARVGRVAFVTGGRPLVLPVNHAVDGHTVVFRTDDTTLLGGRRGREPVAFEVDDVDADRQTGWSVVIAGEVELVGDDRSLRHLAGLGLEPWAPGARDSWLRIVPTTVTGRVISRRRHGADGAFVPYMPPG